MPRTRAKKDSIATVGTQCRMIVPTPFHPGDKMKFVEVNSDWFRAERVREVTK